MTKYCLLILILMFVWGFFIEPHIIVLKKYKTKFLNGKKIVFVSDFHISKNDKGRLERIVRLINAQKPDIVISGGDYIKGHTGTVTLPVEEQAEILGRIKAPIVSVLGNHDGWYDRYRVKKALEKNGIMVLMNSSTKVEDIYISGVEDMQTGSPNIEAALENTDLPRILVSHTPDIYYDVKDYVDLILAGHVHGGQVSVPFYGALLVPSIYGNRFSGGDYKETQNRMIVSKGLGTSILGVRFNAAPEIIVLEGN